MLDILKKLEAKLSAAKARSKALIGVKSNAAVGRFLFAVLVPVRCERTKTADSVHLQFVC